MFKSNSNFNCLFFNTVLSGKISVFLLRSMKFYGVIREEQGILVVVSLSLGSDDKRRIF